MKKLTLIKTFLLSFTFVCLLSSCENKEELFISLEDKNSERTYDVALEGDTLIIPYSSNLSPDEIQINCRAEWISFKKTKKEIIFYIKKDSEKSNRQANISLHGIKKREEIPSIIITIRQISNEDNTIKNNFLHLYYAPLSDEAISSSSFKFILEASAQEVQKKQIIKTNLSTDLLEYQFSYKGEEKNWVSDFNFIEENNRVSGFKLFVKEIPAGVEQRRMFLIISDKANKDLHVTIEFVQIHRTIELENPEHDQFKIMPSHPQEYQVFLKTEIPIDDLRLETFQGSHNYYRNYDNSKSKYNNSWFDPFIWHNSNRTQYNEPTTYQSDIKLKTIDGKTAVCGLTALAPYPRSFASENLRKRITNLKISSKINDCILFFCFEQEKEPYYYTFENAKTDTLVNVPQEGGEISLQVRSNLHFDRNSAETRYAHPDWIQEIKSIVGSEYIDLNFPDVIKYKNRIPILANTYRNEREYDLEIIYNSTIHFLPPPTPTVRSVIMKIKQEGFKGDYEFKFLDENQSDTTLLPASTNDKIIGLKTNLSKEQIKIKKITARSGWINYEWRVTESGIVIGLKLLIDENKSDKDRTATYQLEGPEGEGFDNLIFSIKQNKKP